jgi:hypothetical protein
MADNSSPESKSEQPVGESEETTLKKGNGLTPREKSPAFRKRIQPGSLLE